MPLLVRELSDLHTEFQMRCYTEQGMRDFVNQVLPILPHDEETVLIIAGDLGNARKVDLIVWFLAAVAVRFKHVIYVLGNHEHYSGILDYTLGTIDDVLVAHLVEICDRELYKKITIAGNEPVRLKLDNYLFLCGTMWTNYGGDGEYGETARSWVMKTINDHRLIGHKFEGGMSTVSRPEVMREIFTKTIAQFGEWLEEQTNEKTIVVTHHLPSFDVVDAKYKKDEVSRYMNHGFASDLNSFIEHHKPRAWFFGHTHTPFNTMIGSTRAICNPYGYESEANFLSGRFDPKAVHHFDSEDPSVQAT